MKSKTLPITHQEWLQWIDDTKQIWLAQKTCDFSHQLHEAYGAQIAEAKATNSNEETKGGQQKVDNTNSLIVLIGHFGITLPKNAIEWRVCYSPEGSPGQPGQHILHGQTTQLLTDGIVSWFLLGDHETLFFGHKANFVPDKEEIDPSSKTPRKHTSKPITDPKLIALAMED